MKTKIWFIAVTTVCITGPVQSGQDGKQLFEYHGCINCHGAEAKAPISKIIPKLAGKPQKELFTKARKILSGQGASKESEIMHAAFYSPAQCDMPPTDAELTAITTYLSGIN